MVARLQQEVSTLDRYGSSQRIDSCDSIEADLNTMKEGLQGYFDVPLERQPGLGQCCLWLLLVSRTDSNVQMPFSSYSWPCGAWFAA